MPQLNHWPIKWELDLANCPCDQHFNDWVAKNKIKNKVIYHFGTGAHHLVGLKQASNRSGNAVLAITASMDEYAAYLKASIERPKLAKTYVVYFGDIYLTNPKLLPELDVVTMFHLCEFSYENTTSSSYGGVSDGKLLDMFTGRARRGAHFLFYTRSMSWPQASPVVEKWARRSPVRRVGSFKSLLVFRKK